MLKSNLIINDLPYREHLKVLRHLVWSGCHEGLLWSLYCKMYSDNYHDKDYNNDLQRYRFSAHKTSDHAYSQNDSLKVPK